MHFSEIIKLQFGKKIPYIVLYFKKQPIPFKYQPNKFCRAKGHLVKIKCAKNGLKKLKEKKKEHSMVAEMRAEPSPVVHARDHELFRVPQRNLCEKA